MNAFNPPVRMLPESDSERMERIREELDVKDVGIADDLFSGRFDARRLRSSAQALAMIADTPARPKIDPGLARRKADEAVRRLAEGLL